MGSLILSRSFHVNPPEEKGRMDEGSEDGDSAKGKGDEEGSDEEDEDEDDASTVGMVPMAGQSEWIDFVHHYITESPSLDALNARTDASNVRRLLILL
jgi:hypothetical protein